MTVAAHRHGSSRRAPGRPDDAGRADAARCFGRGALLPPRVGRGRRAGRRAGRSSDGTAGGISRPAATRSPRCAALLELGRERGDDRAALHGRRGRLLRLRRHPAARAAPRPAARSLSVCPDAAFGLFDGVVAFDHASAGASCDRARRSRARSRRRRERASTSSRRCSREASRAAARPSRGALAPAATLPPDAVLGRSTRRRCARPRSTSAPATSSRWCLRAAGRARVRRRVRGLPRAAHGNPSPVQYCPRRRTVTLVRSSPETGPVRKSGDAAREPCRSPARGRAARRPPRIIGSPRSCSPIPRSAPST